MVEEVRRQFDTIPGILEGHSKPDYATCVKISTDASIKEMIPPGALVMLTPLIVGTFFGVETLSGVLAGALVSGVQVTLCTKHETSRLYIFFWSEVCLTFCILYFPKQIAISASNTGGAWDNAKKYIEVKIHACHLTSTNYIFHDIFVLHDFPVSDE